MQYEWRLCVVTKQLRVSLWGMLLRNNSFLRFIVFEPVGKP